MISHDLELVDLAATEKLALWLAPRLAVGDVLCLQGDLGAGKTTFARFLIAALGVEDEVPSPTFNLVLTYQAAAFDIWHFDLFRLKSAAEVHELGIEQAFAEALSLIEWPERMAGLLPPDRLELALVVDDEGEKRHARLSAHGALAARFCAAPS